jgi:Tol biopolymer transport system component/DNA-binding SARP family transcriptional activator
MLALLAVAGDRALSRDKLAAYLWPESDEEHARNSLSQALSSLRRELGVDDVVLGSADLRLNAESIASDVQDFVRLVNQGKHADAVAIYAGPFLDGVFFKGALELERWIEQERHRLERMYADAVEHLAAAATVQGDTASAVRWWRLRAELTPLDATPALGLMRALAAAGDSASALQHFRVYETLLRSELETDPAPEVVSLANELRSIGRQTPRPEPVQRRGEAFEQSNAAPEELPRNERPTRRRWRRGVGVVFTAGAAVSAITLFAKPFSLVRERQVVIGAIVPVASSAESLFFDASISPDGQHVAYAAGPPGRMRIVVRSLAGTRTLVLAEDLVGNQRWPRWSADGTKIVFQVLNPETRHAEIYEVPPFGGTPELLVQNGAWPSMSRDGKLAYVAGGIWVRPPNGGAATLIDSTPNAGWPSWSPDGRRIVFASDDQHFLGSSYGGIAKNPVWVIDADGQHRRKLYSADALHAAPVWSADGNSILFVSDRDGIHDVYRQGIDADSLVGPLERVTVGARVYTFTLSADGARMAYNSLRLNEGSNIWVAPIGESITSFASARAVTRGIQQIESFSISHDGRWLAFDSNRDADGYVHIYKVALNGTTIRGEPIRVTHKDADDYDPRWAPDDSEIAFHRKTRDNRDVYVIGADGRRETRVTTDTTRYEYHPDWSPDGQSLTYTSPRDGGSDYQVFTVSRDATGGWSEPKLVSQPKQGGAVARWSPAGNDLALWPGALTLLSLQDGTTRQPLTAKELGERITALYWGKDANELYMQTRDSNRVTSFWKYDFRRRTPTRILTLTDSILKTRQQYFDVHGRNLFFTISPAGSEVFVASLAWRR